MWLHIHVELIHVGKRSPGGSQRKTWWRPLKSLLWDVFPWTGLYSLVFAVLNLKKNVCSLTLLSLKVALRPVPLKCTMMSLQFSFTKKTTLVQIIAWWHQATSHYLIQCWASSATAEHIEAETIWIPFPRQHFQIHFQMHFLERKCLNSG